LLSFSWLLTCAYWDGIASVCGGGIIYPEPREREVESSRILQSRIFAIRYGIIGP
jgi:hypothetical protein